MFLFTGPLFMVKNSVDCSIFFQGIVPSKIQLTPNTPYASRSKIYVTTSSPNFTRNVNCLIPNADINTQRNVTIDSDIQYTGINLDDLYY